MWLKWKLAILNCTANTTSVQIIAKAHEKGHQFKRRNDKIIKTSTRVSIILYQFSILTTTQNVINWYRTVLYWWLTPMSTCKMTNIIEQHWSAEVWIPTCKVSRIRNRKTFSFPYSIVIGKKTYNVANIHFLQDNFCTQYRPILEFSYIKCLILKLKERQLNFFLFAKLSM